METENELFTIKQVKKSLKQIKNNKSHGPEGIPVELFKYAPDVALEKLTLIFNKGPHATRAHLSRFFFPFSNHSSKTVFHYLYISVSYLL